jgi:hypothetical protein
LAEATGQTDNLDMFNKAFGESTQPTDELRIQEAAFATKTGEWAKEAGFDRVEVVESKPHDWPYDAVPGRYFDEMIVRFTKASR